MERLEKDYLIVKAWRSLHKEYSRYKTLNKCWGLEVGKWLAELVWTVLFYLSISSIFIVLLHQVIKSVFNITFWLNLTFWYYILLISLLNRFRISSLRLEKVVLRKFQVLNFIWNTIQPPFSCYHYLQLASKSASRVKLPNGCKG